MLIHFGSIEGSVKSNGNNTLSGRVKISLQFSRSCHKTYYILHTGCVGCILTFFIPKRIYIKAVHVTDFAAKFNSRGIFLTYKKMSIEQNRQKSRNRKLKRKKNYILSVFRQCHPIWIDRRIHKKQLTCNNIKIGRGAN